MMSIETQQIPNVCRKLWRHKGYCLTRSLPSKVSDNQLSRFDIKLGKMNNDKGQVPSKYYFKKRNKTDKQRLKALISGRKRLSGNRCKELRRARARRATAPGSTLENKDELPPGDCNIIEDRSPNEVDITVSEPWTSWARTERMDIHQKAQTSSHLAERSLDAQVMKERNVETGHNLICRDGQAHQHLTDSPKDTDVQKENEECVICRRQGKLLSCSGQGCTRSFHLGCINPPLSCIPPGVWHCIWCVRKKIELGVHAVSEGPESTLDTQEVVTNTEVMQTENQYLVKYKGLSHVHNRWIPEKQLLAEAPALLSKSRKHNQKYWKADWNVPYRLLQKRLLIFPESCDIFLGRDGCHSSCRYEWLVKWKGLKYEHATWELENASFFRSPEALKLINDYEYRHGKASTEAYASKRDEGQHTDLFQLSGLGIEGSAASCDDHLTYVNRLRRIWLRRQNAVVIDDQERIARVVLFILSVQKDVKQPFLIITSSRCLSLWETEFSHWVSSANVVVYKGNRDVRESIRTLEFYNESGCIMFEVLLSSAGAVIETFFQDLDSMESLNWEAVVVDECQRPSMSMHLNHIKTLHANMRLLLLTGQIKDSRSNYCNFLSVLDPEYDDSREDTSKVGPNNDMLKLKEKLIHFLAYQCQSAMPRFVEYWVPVQLTDVQREQYCSSLLSNSILLCSHSKNDSVEALHNILISSLKCCNHPYILDHSLRSSVIQGVSLADQLDAEIAISGKLQLLDKILVEIKERGLRVLILFQGLGGSGQVSTGDILDDFIHQKYGDSYARIDGDILHKKKWAAADMFNNKDSGKFVCLIETRACVPSIKLLSVDTIILFDSNWDPLNDLRALQKITIESQFEQLKVFRLYSFCTVEEKVLVLAKQGMNIEKNIRNIRPMTCQKLLTWGASYQFSRLNYNDGCAATASCSSYSFEQTLRQDLSSELSALLPKKSENVDYTECKLISEVQQNGGTYFCKNKLLGERDDQSMDNFSVVCQLTENEPQHIFWTSLLQGRQPRWNYLPNQSRKIRRKAQFLSDFPEGSELNSQSRENGEKKTNENTNLTFLESQSFKKKLRAQSKKRKFAGIDSNHNKASTISRVELEDAGSPTTAHLNSPAQDNSFALDQQPISLLVEDTDWDSASLGSTNPSLDRENNPHVESSPVTFEEPQHASIPGEGRASESDSLESNHSSLSRENNLHHLESSFMVTSEVPQSAGSDPLQMEMDKITRDKEQAIKLHGETKLKLLSECEKEMEEIRLKYDLLLQNAEMAFLRKTEDLETSYNKVYVNKLLAGTMMRKYTTDFTDEMCGLYLTRHVERTIARPEQSVERASIAGMPGAQLVQAVGHSSAIDRAAEGTIATSEEALARYVNSAALANSAQLDNNSSEIQNTVSTVSGNPVAVLQITTQSPEVEETCTQVLSSGHRGQLLIPTIRYRGNHQAGLIVRAPAPHLRNIVNMETPVSAAVAPLLEPPVNMRRSCVLTKHEIEGFTL